MKEKIEISKLYEFAKSINIDLTGSTSSLTLIENIYSIKIMEDRRKNITIFKLLKAREHLRNSIRFPSHETINI